MKQSFKASRRYKKTKQKFDMKRKQKWSQINVNEQIHEKEEEE